LRGHFEAGEGEVRREGREGKREGIKGTEVMGKTPVFPGSKFLIMALRRLV